ncbi:MAG: dihydroorotate dehydrogenase (NAD+) catalytic subunit [Myxococcota bacterium]|jgi:dihydroorotate dehydrogenase (NAD+) catalytic subunit
MLSTKIAALEFTTPLMTASGTFGHDPAALNFIDPGDLGALVLKTVTPEARYGNPAPRMAEFEGGIVNAIGLENRGLAYWRDTVAPTLEGLPVPVIANAGGHCAADYVEVVAAFNEMSGVSAIELNLSCPNVEGGIRYSTDAIGLGEVVSACRAVCSKPMFVKLSPNVTDIQPLARAAADAGADALTVCNTLIGMLVDWRSQRTILANSTGGMSGPAMKPVAMRMVSQCATAVDIPIIASGGAESADDVLEFVVAGATAVQIGTAVFRNPAIISQIASDLRRILADENLNLADLRGSLKL